MFTTDTLACPHERAANDALVEAKTTGSPPSRTPQAFGSVHPSITDPIRKHHLAVRKGTAALFRKGAPRSKLVREAAEGGLPFQGVAADPLLLTRSSGRTPASVAAT